MGFIQVIVSKWHSKQHQMSNAKQPPEIQLPHLCNLTQDQIVSLCKFADFTLKGKDRKGKCQFLDENGDVVSQNRSKKTLKAWFVETIKKPFRRAIRTWREGQRKKMSPKRKRKLPGKAGNSSRKRMMTATAPHSRTQSRSVQVLKSIKPEKMEKLKIMNKKQERWRKKGVRAMKKALRKKQMRKKAQKRKRVDVASDELVLKKAVRGIALRKKPSFCELTIDCVTEIGSLSSYFPSPSGFSL